MPPLALPTTRPPLCGSLVIAGNKIIVLNTASAIGVWLYIYIYIYTPIFRVKHASSSQDTVDYIVQRAARKNSSGNPGLSFA